MKIIQYLRVTDCRNTAVTIASTRAVQRGLIEAANTVKKGPTTEATLENFQKSEKVKKVEEGIKKVVA
jgi:hypothetical protein